MDTHIYTHAMWRVRAGNEDRFIDAWDRLAHAFSGLTRPPIRGTLIRSLEDPTLFYSFGPWHGPADVEAMRADSSARTAIEAVVALCEAATPGTFRVVRHVEVTEPSG